MKKIALNENKKNILKKMSIIVPIVAVLSFLITLSIKMDSDFMDSCMEQGYSKEYCELHR